MLLFSKSEEKQDKRLGKGGSRSVLFCSGVVVSSSGSSAFWAFHHAHMSLPSDSPSEYQDDGVVRYGVRSCHGRGTAPRYLTNARFFGAGFDFI